MASATRSRRSAVRAALAFGLTLGAAIAAAPAASEPQAAAGSLGFQVTLRQAGPFTLPCPGGVPDLSAPPETACVPFTGAGSIRGLGSVSVTYTALLEWGPPACPANVARPLANTGSLTVAGKGEIFFAFAAGAQCAAAWQSEPQEFTITGGTGPFAGASGRGKRARGSSVPGRPGTDVWAGTLEVQGLAFDLTPPELHGVGSTTVRARNGAKSARVTFEVTATDGVDGAVPVSCRPRSGSRFGMGRTTVRCTATDSSANTATRAFTVTVKRRR